jgi:hypothetical protein
MITADQEAADKSDLAERAEGSLEDRFTRVVQDTRVVVKQLGEDIAPEPAQRLKNGQRSRSA